MNTHKNREPEKILVFLSLWCAAFICLAIVSTIIFFVLGICIYGVVNSSGRAIIPWAQYINVLMNLSPFILYYSPFPAFVLSLLLMRQNNLRHKAFMLPNGKLPIYRVQKAVIKANTCFQEAFIACQNSLVSLDQSECRFLEINETNGIIVAHIKNRKVNIYGETIRFSLVSSSAEEIEIYISSSTNALLKGLDYGKNAANIHGIIDFFKLCKIGQNNGVQACLI